MKLKQHLLFVLLIISFLAACNKQVNDTAVSDINYIPFEDEALGVSLVHPEGWAIHNAFGGLTVASSQEVIDGSSLAEIGDNGFVLVIPGELGIFNMQINQQLTDADAMKILDIYKQLLEREGQTHQEIEPPQALTIDGQPAAMMVTRSQEEGKNLIMILAVIMNDDFMALVSAASLEPTAEEMRPIFDQIIQSVHISTPTELE